jgi:hypothetical protein
MHMVFVSLMLVWLSVFSEAVAVPVAPTQVRVFVMYGQGSVLTSPGMNVLTNQLKGVDKRLVVTLHNWDDYGDIVRAIRKLPANVPVIVIGYSLGANATTWVSNYVPNRPIELIVAYDPSILTKVSPAGKNVKRALLYHNNSFDPWGHARIPGPKVETTETYMPHLAVSLSQSLHNRTIDAVKRVLKNTR